MIFNIDREKYIDSGLVNETPNWTGNLLIYNYTQKCQFSKAWDDVTMMCRGLIVDAISKEIVAQPFKKFFNIEEHVAKGLPIPDEAPYILKKLDGSLGILYWNEGKPWIATRGSFKSEQAIWATDWLRENIDCSKFDKNLTYLFEIIIPWNKIVVNYNFSGLILIDVLNTHTGLRGTKVPIPKELRTVEYYESKDGQTSYEQLKKLNTPNEEGFVLFYPTTELRLKIKFEDYVKLHKIITGLSEIGIWEMMEEGKNPSFTDIPDEMFERIGGVMKTIVSEFSYIEGVAQHNFNEVMTVLGKNPSRKDIAFFFQRRDNPSILFAMLDGKDYKKIIWQMVRPHGSKTFKKDIDA